MGAKNSDMQVRTPMPRISELAWTVVHVVFDMLRALEPARELDKGKGEGMGQDICLPHINRGHSWAPMSYSTALHCCTGHTVRTGTTGLVTNAGDSSKP